MKSTIVCTLFSISILSCTLVMKNKQENYVLTIKQCKYEKIDTTDRWGVSLLANTTLTNNSNDTLNYASYVCEKEAFYHIDNERIRFISPMICYTEFLTVLTLAPHESVDLELRLRKQLKDTTKVKFKIGLDMIKVKNDDENKVCNVYEIVHEYQEGNKKNFIWSNPVEI